MRNQFVRTITDLIEEDESLFLLLGDIGVFGFRHLLKEYPLRAYNLGICEQATISLASGLAMTGFTPVVHSIAPFLVERAYEQLKIDFGYQQLGGNFVSVGASYDYNKLGATHHCPADVSILNQIPGMQIVVPGTAKEFDVLFRESYDNDKPTYFRLSEHVNIESHNVKFGEILQLGGTGNKFTVLVVGPALESVRRLGFLLDEDIDVLYCSTVEPLDMHTIGTHIPSGRLLVVEPYYSAMLSDIANSLNADIVSVNPNKSFIDTGYDQTTYMQQKINETLEKLEWV